MITIEALFPEVCDLYGDGFNLTMLRRTLPDARIVETPLSDEPYFARNDVQLIYMGPMPEHIQELAIERLRPHMDRIRELIEKDVIFLMTGNALEVFGKEIQDASGKRIPCLGLFEGISKRDLLKPRYNGFYLGEMPDESGSAMEIIGFKSQFSHTYFDNSGCGAFKNIRGIGICPDAPYEGVRIHNFFGTYLLGPVLVLNPPFFRYLLRLLGVSDPKLPFEEEMEDAYRQRLIEFKDPKKSVEF